MAHDSLVADFLVTLGNVDYFSHDFYYQISLSQVVEWKHDPWAKESGWYEEGYKQFINQKENCMWEKEGMHDVWQDALEDKKLSAPFRLDRQKSQHLQSSLNCFSQYL